ncbi:sulfite exporter TauE/SafE family protein [Egicoccus halophilus]|uniref:Probable membrane transporter protein n=1 Tax=Egicoccus halophilus TaxID=1670830 RepID=A0A8J3AG79_9ACTN|nr:sulfite exporter TauE/SafE family protein [Egicoccus halophilus]GGI07538.1 UPF0721 transmembrane protein [Egicoccus halophilus]
MSALQVVILFFAAAGAGAVNAVVGAGTLITFPTLLAMGVPPVTANVSNAVGLVPGGLAAAGAYHRVLHSQRRLVARLLVPSAAGAALGGLLVLAFDPAVFAAAVPVLLVGSAVLALAQPRITQLMRSRPGRRTVPSRPAARDEDAVGVTGASAPLMLGVGLTGIYGGYFGAAQGVVLLCLLGLLLQAELTAVNGLKNLLSTTANLLAASIFVVAGVVDWRIAGVVAVGSVLGGWFGAKGAQRLNPRLLRLSLVVVAVAAAIRQIVT